MKKIVCLIVAAIFLISSPMVAFSFGAKKHNQILVEVLFGDEDWADTEKNEKNIELLEAASYLALDQFKGDGESSLTELKEANVKGLPESIDDFNLEAGGKNHRKYTHMGWNHEYKKDKAKWEIRKAILCSTSNNIFKFGLAEINNKFGEKCDGFSALVYYIHVLGDHSDPNNKRKEVDKDVMLPFAREKASKKKPDLFYELKKVCIERLFEDQSDSKLYKSFLKEYNDLARDARKLQGKKINTDEEIEQWAQYKDDLLTLLEDYIPSLLKEEEFFAEVFYAD